MSLNTFLNREDLKFVLRTFENDRKDFSIFERDQKTFCFSGMSTFNNERTDNITASSSGADLFCTGGVLVQIISAPSDF